ncbi:MAG: HTH-type transcriptional activator IlvY [Spirochaetes bacterium]|nr:MAG: HTH-type transcriptional activator IlvY [Spirochaetota bacterium]
MDIHELQLFIHLAGTLHFAKTSREMNISPSALSRSIRRLEDECGKVLFLRDNRTVTITEEGKAFEKFAKQVIDSHRNLMNQFRKSEEELSGLIRIYASVTASYTILADILKKFRQKYPRVRIELQTGSASGAIEQVQNGKVDITIAAKPNIFPDSLAFLPLIETPLYFIAPRHPGSVYETVSKQPINWEGTPFILPDKGVSRHMMNAWFHHMHITPEIYASVSGNEAIIAMVALGFGVGIVPKLVIDKSPMKEDIITITSAPKMQPYTVGICTSKRLLASPAVQSFREVSRTLYAV